MKRSSLLFILSVVAVSAVHAVSHVTVTNDADGWNLRVEGVPFFIKGTSYAPDKVGEDPLSDGSDPFLRDWMLVNDNGNSLIDAPEEAYWDKNGNNVKDTDEPGVGDFQLLKSMGVNTIRLYHHASNSPTVQDGYGNGFNPSLESLYNHPPNIALLRKMYADHGIRVLMGDFLGAFGVGSGGFAGADYTSTTEKNRMRASVTQMVNDFKNEDFLLAYILGNENNNSSITETNAQQNMADYTAFLQEIVTLIQTMDPNHPVFIANWEAMHLANYAAGTPALDGFGANFYPSGDAGFGNFFVSVKNTLNKPVLLTEYGDIEATITGFTPDPPAGNHTIDEGSQLPVHATRWGEIVANAAGAAGQDNAIGGVVFSWTDMWHWSGFPDHHNAFSPYTNEFAGLTTQGNGTNSPFLRGLRPTYWFYRNQWRTPGGNYVWNNAGGTGVGFDTRNWVQLNTPAPMSNVVFDGSVSHADANIDFPVALQSIQFINGYAGTVTISNDVKVSDPIIIPNGSKLFVLVGGTLTVKGISQVQTGGRLEMGAVSGPVPANKFSQLIFDGSAGATGLLVHAGGSLYAHGPLTPTPFTGDYNGDCVVDSGDHIKWKSQFGLSVTPFSGADGNGNGVIDAADYVVWRNVSGSANSACFAAGTAVLIDRINAPSNYSLISQGSVFLVNAEILRTNVDGLNLLGGSAWFNHAAFDRAPTGAAATYITVNGLNSVGTFNNVAFKNSDATTPFNVKTVGANDGLNWTFTNWSGVRGGENFDSDPLNQINWIPATGAGALVEEPTGPGSSETELNGLRARDMFFRPTRGEKGEVTIGPDSGTSVASAQAVNETEVRIYDRTGREIGRFHTASNVVTWDGLDSDGRRAAPGTYLLRCQKSNGEVVKFKAVVSN